MYAKDLTLPNKIKNIYFKINLEMSFSLLTFVLLSERDNGWRANPR